MTDDIDPKILEKKIFFYPHDLSWGSSNYTVICIHSVTTSQIWPILEDFYKLRNGSVICIHFVTTSHFEFWPILEDFDGILNILKKFYTTKLGEIFVDVA